MHDDPGHAPITDSDCRLWNEDCVAGMRAHIATGSVDLVVADPPFAIEGHALDRHYNRDADNVIAGYREVAPEDYADFSRQWISESARVLRPGGSLYIVSGWSHLREILDALEHTDLVEVNHLVWKFNFPVFTTRKWVSTHYHLLYWAKPPDRRRTFNTYCRFEEAADTYHDRMDVLDIKREYRPGEEKNVNTLPDALVERLIRYSSTRGDLVLDPFMGGFTTARVARRLGRRVAGFELNPVSFGAFAAPAAATAEEPEPLPIPPDPVELARRLKMRAARKRRRNPAAA